MDGRKEGTWLAGSVGTRGPSGQSYLHTSLEMVQHFNSIVTTRGLAQISALALMSALLEGRPSAPESGALIPILKSSLLTACSYSCYWLVKVQVNGDLRVYGYGEKDAC